MKMLACLIASALFAGGCANGSAQTLQEHTQRAEPECVVLLHGLGRTSRSMRKMAAHLQKAGYTTVNLDYPSTKHGVAELAHGILARTVQECCTHAPRVHFVTHSLGGILVRTYLAGERPTNLGRVVMLSPPNQGSEIVDALGGLWLYGVLLGPAGKALGTGPQEVPKTLGPVDFELGVITGNRSLNPYYSWLLAGEDDGKVSVDRARVEGMDDFLVVPHSHTFIMRADDVIGQVLHFLQEGCFRYD